MSDRARKKAKKDVAKLKRKWDRQHRIAVFFRMLGKLPRQYKKIPVNDYDKRTKQLSAFREAYSDFFKQLYYEENSELQNHTTQLFWHRLYLQKQRMKRFDITMEMESMRVERTEFPKDSIIEKTSFDGRYEVSDVNEAICSKRSFKKNGEVIGTFRDFDSINYNILSTKQKGDNEIYCPNCGHLTTRENLIDGCDYCKTKFTIEDLEDKMGSLDFQIEVSIEGLSQKGRDAERSFDASAGAMVRQFDPNFSFTSFKTSIFNKVAAIHYANAYQQINAFSDHDLSYLLDEYKNVVNIDFDGLIVWDNSILVRNGLAEKNDYYVEDGMQKIKVLVPLVLFEYIDGKIVLRNETIKLNLEKSADCKTQNICGPSVFTCSGCGTSISLLEGKTCPYCGKELNLKQYDWVITGYESKLGEYGNSRRTYN